MNCNIFCQNIMIKSEQEKRDKKICEAYFNQDKVRFIAAIYGLFPQRIYQIWKENKLDPKKRLDK